MPFCEDCGKEIRLGLLCEDCEQVELAFMRGMMDVGEEGYE
jgi:hypothetical protein